MELRYLQTFLTVVAAGSFYRAAQQLNYTRSTVTFQMQQLERELGFPLFERRGKRMCLTREGEAVRPLAEQMLGDYRRMLAIGEPERGKLRVAVAESLLVYRLQPVIRRFREELPGVELEIHTAPCNGMSRLLLRGEADLAVHYAVEAEDDSLCGKQLAEYPLVFFGAAGLTEAERDFSTPGQRKNVSFLDMETDGFYRKTLNGALKTRDITLPEGIILGSVSAILQCAEDGLGVAVLPAFAVEKGLREGALREIDLPLSPGSVAVRCSRYRNRWVTPAMRRFLELLDATSQQSAAE